MSKEAGEAGGSDACGSRASRASGCVCRGTSPPFAATSSADRQSGGMEHAPKLQINHLLTSKQLRIHLSLRREQRCFSEYAVTRNNILRLARPAPDSV